MPYDYQYELRPAAEEMNDETKKRFRVRFAQLQESLAKVYSRKVAQGLIQRDEALEKCFHEILSTAAREFGLTLICRKYRR